MLRDLSPQAIMMGLLAALVGFASSFAVVLQGLRAVGASPEEAASGLMALSVTMGLAGIGLSLWTRQPVSAAWSTPGAALLVSAPALPGGFPAAVGGFLVCGALLTIAGLWRPLGRAVAAIPGPIANAMLAGVLMGLCLAPVKAIAFDPLLGLPIVLAWAVAGRLNRFLAVPAALVAFVVVVALGVPLPDQALSDVLAAAVPQPVIVMPIFDLEAIFGIALPLFVVTMASQNIPGIAVLKGNGYTPAPGPLFTATGVLSVAGAPFGGHAINLAAITAALCAGPDANPDPGRRYWAAVVAGLIYLLFGAFAGAATSFVTLAPSVLIEAVAGLALIGAFVAAAVAAFSDAQMREPAAVTFLTAASGISFLGIGGAFWGLIAGLVLAGLIAATTRAR